MTLERNKQIFNAGLALAVALVLSSAIGSWAFTRAKTGEYTVTVTGSARRRINSDLVVWRTNVTSQAAELSEAFRILRTNVPVVRQYLISQGIPAEQIVVSSITTTTQRTRNNYGEETGQITGYALSQSLEITSSEVDKVTQVSRSVTELINQGIVLESQAPQYHYTRLGDLKVEMLAEAARDARTRAEQIAASTGAQVGPVRSARMGVMQITAANSNEVSDSGISDTASLEKDITAVVNASFAIE